MHGPRFPPTHRSSSCVSSHVGTGICTRQLLGNNTVLPHYRSKPVTLTDIDRFITAQCTMSDVALYSCSTATVALDTLCAVWTLSSYHTNTSFLLPVALQSPGSLHSPHAAQSPDPQYSLTDCDESDDAAISRRHAPLLSSAHVLAPCNRPTLLQHGPTAQFP